jgi:hypothetical protein
MAGLVAAALIVSVAPASAEPSGLHGGQWKACSFILSAAQNSEPGSVQQTVLMDIYHSFCG